MKDKEERKFWNDPENIKWFNDYPPSEYWREFLLLSSDRIGQKALDLGCGAGRHTKLLSDLGYDVYACDRHLGMVCQTRANLQEAGWTKARAEKKIVKQSMEKLSYPDNFFDLVICHGVYHNAFDLKMFKEALAESSRVLKKGGHLLFNLFTNELKPKELKILDRDNCLYATKEGLKMILISPNRFLKLASSYGLRPVDKKLLVRYRSKVTTGERAVFRGVFLKK